MVETWDETTPPGTGAAGAISLGDDRIRELKRALRERLAVDHEFYADESGQNVGIHTKVTLKEAADIGTGAAGLPILGAQTSDGVPELTFTDEDDADLAITYKGGINISKGKMASQAAGDLFYATSATAISRLAKGTAAQQLRMNAGADAPEWFTPVVTVYPPTGTMLMWAGALASPPDGYLACDGSAVSRETYADLFTAIGTTFGSGDGSTTFNVPNMTNAFPYGASEGSAAGNSSVGQSKKTVAGRSISGNDSAVTMTFDSGGGLGAGDNNLAYRTFDFMAPYLAIGFIIKT